MKKYIVTLCALALSYQAFSQNLNPTVEVTNTYQGKLLEIEKNSVEMAVPDSLTKFNLDFKYSIFDRPYKGAYEFTPYFMDMKPTADAFDAKRFYLRLGAGYTFHPQADIVYSPYFKDKAFRINLYGFHRSYFGRYSNIAVTQESDDAVRKPFAGYDSKTKVGAAGGFDWRNSYMKFDVFYKGIHTGNDRYSLPLNSFSSIYTNMNSFGTDLRYGSANREGTYFMYDVRARYSYSGEKLSFGYVNPMGINDLRLDFTLGPVVRDVNKILVDAIVRYVTYNDKMGQVRGAVTEVGVIPHYIYDNNRWRMSLGVKVDLKKSYSANPSAAESVGFFKAGQIIYPDVHIGFEAVKSYLNLYLDVTGGPQENYYTSLKESNSFFNILYGKNNWEWQKNPIERINASLGVQGNIASKFRFDLKGGYAVYAQGITDAVYYNTYPSAGKPSGNIAAISFNDYSMLYSDFTAIWDSNPVIVDVRLNYRESDIYKKKLTGFEPSRFSGAIRTQYNWNKRIYAGMDIYGSVARRGYIDPVSSVYSDRFSAIIPGYVDLGLNAEYKFNRYLSFWAEAGNLLNMTIQRHPLIAERGMIFTAGICLNL